MANLGLPEDGGYQGSGGYGPPRQTGDNEVISWKTIDKIDLGKIVLRPFYKSFFVNKKEH